MSNALCPEEGVWRPYSSTVFLCGRPVTWGSEPRLHSHELTKFNYLMFRIACHKIFPISHMHTIPIDRCVFLYSLITSVSICFLSLFIQTIVEVHRNNARKQHLFFPIFIHRILGFIELEHFPSSKLVHLIAPIGATFLKQRNAQKKPTKPSVGTTKRQRVEPSHEDVPIDPTATIAVAAADDVDVAANADGPSIASPSLRFMLERVLEMQSSQHIMMETFHDDIGGSRIAFG